MPKEKKAKPLTPEEYSKRVKEMRMNLVVLTVKIIKELLQVEVILMH